MRITNMNRENKITQLLVYYIELRELLEKNTVDLNADGMKLKQIAAIKTESQLIFIKSMEKMKAKLTPEQLEMLKKVRSMDSPVGPPKEGKKDA